MQSTPIVQLPHARRLAGCLLLVAGFLLSLQAAARGPEEFIRLAEDEQGKPRALQVALARYADGQGRQLDLVSAVHVADRDYFVDLQQRFGGYDIVLYELVGSPDGEGERPSGTGMGLVSLLQGGMKDALGLAFQLDEIDYERANFVHADMTTAEFADSMKEREETWLGTFMQLWAASAVMQSRSSKPPEAALLKVLLADDRQAAFKRVMAESLVEQQQVLEVLAGEEGSVLITERNRKALSVLERELDDGARSVALFYGAGHMPDFHRRLTGEYGFELEQFEWLDAWELH